MIAVGLRKRDEQSAAAENEPRLIAVPERRDGVHHHVAPFFPWLDVKEDAEAEPESVEDDVERHGGREQSGPDQR